ncbi:MAG: undecaprenyl/decaprenyl-phosphate alpha-N-acetylglucosaminyl 1-phosphate transferase [Candidatus Bipolaricaulota bacterium]|nr:undecaprenyl/decaprenyl-phosphate alpha-N-acetylglucosaminyl 1-phosphate transferase [Candidatus Bipolaricaulota bacterium]
MVREFFIGFLSSVVFTALSRLVAPRLGLLDSPDDSHKAHGRTVAIGGWAIALAAVFALLNVAELWRLALGSFVALLVGLLDDRFGLSPKAKLLGQLLCAAVAVLIAGWTVQSVTLFGIEIALGWLAIPFTLFWVVGAINAFNLLDGIDGLATGGAALIFGATALIAHQSGNSAVLALSVSFVGILLGFLLFNWAPAKVFLGDGGTHFVGYWLAILSIQATQADLSVARDVPILVSIFSLGVPIADTAWAIVRRLRERKPILQADRGHLHHRLLAFGLSERTVVLILYGAVAITCAVAVAIFS